MTVTTAYCVKINVKFYLLRCRQLKRLGVSNVSALVGTHAVTRDILKGPLAGSVSIYCMRASFCVEETSYLQKPREAKISLIRLE